MKTSRQRLLEYIQTHSPISTFELSHALRMTEANARHHLTILKAVGLIEVVSHRAQKGKGRPSQLFAPSQQSLSHNFGLLASSLLQEIKRLPTLEQRQEMMIRVAARLCEGNPEYIVKSSSLNLTQRLFITIQRLNELNYQAHWEAHSESPRLILGFCPYTAILHEHPELCQIDAYMLEKLLGAGVQQTAWLSLDGKGTNYCRFKVQQ